MKRATDNEIPTFMRQPHKRPSVLLPILLLSVLAVFLVIASDVESFNLFKEQNYVEELENPINENDLPITELEDALQTALSQKGGNWSAKTWVIDQIQYNESGTEALLWLAVLDPELNAIIASEPQQAFAKKAADLSGWTIILEDDVTFSKTLNASELAAFDMVSKSAPPEFVQKTIPRIYGGYYLPWEAGLTKVLTWSVAHTSCNPTSYCTHAFDFADGTMFPLSAAKAGMVYHWKDTCANGVTTCTNSITLEDRSTTPWTYQIYLHLAYNSIPAELKKVGAAVKMGQFIGNVDDTGYSTGHHVHFMVVAADTLYKTTSGYYFGRAEDITFRDVFINWDVATQGGRPRLAYEAEDYGGEGQTRYLSGNKKMNPLYEQIFPLFFH